MSIPLVDKFITRTYQENRVYICILVILIVVLIITGCAIGFLAITVEVNWAWLEIFVVPVLGYLMDCFKSVIKNNPEILDKATAALEVASKQDRMAEYIREEKETEKQGG